MKTAATATASIVALLLVALPATAQVLFEDNFDSSILAPQWLISPGKGAYSLADNPGHLRYTVDAYCTSRTAGYDPYGTYYDKALWLVCPFEGDQWVLKTAMTFNLRPAAPTNNRNVYFTVREPGVDGTWMASIYRSIGVNDANPYSNALGLLTGDPADSPTTPVFPNSPGPLPSDRWYFEIERNMDHFAIRASNDGDDSTFEYQHEHTFPAGYLVNGHQDIEIFGNGWRGSNSPPGYVDIDFIKIVPEPSTLALLAVVATGLMVFTLRGIVRQP